ncbi:putative sulfite oxidase [Rhodococcus opacus B4]|uniref:Putative sulfite oxidase n=1 Tax=Rhodococcus opacus (strain B4) TaxID=632772 RepID=C1AS41_RHOOB|nr:putative sulfite oxidase [Rhodococcus opacus B4]
MWGKRDGFVVHDRAPFNAEPSRSALAEGAITAIDTFYSRNHGPVPDIERREWRLVVTGLVGQDLTLTFDELTSRFIPRSVVATLQCAGNGGPVSPRSGKSPARIRGVRVRPRPRSGGVFGCAMCWMRRAPIPVTTCMWRSPPRMSPLWPTRRSRTAARSRRRRRGRMRCCWRGR